MSSGTYFEDVDMTLTAGHLIQYSGENVTVISTPSEHAIDPHILNYIKAFASDQIWNLKIIFSILYTSGTIANALLLAYLVYYKKYTSPMFCVILSLCISDLLVCISSLMSLGVVPFVITPLWMCKVTVAFLHASFLSSSYHIVLFSVLRFFQLVYPLASRARITVSLLTKVCLLIWVADNIQSLVINSFIETFRIRYINRDFYICLPTYERKYFDIWSIMTWVIMPFLATVGFHFSKYTFLLCKRSDTIATPSSSGRGNPMRKQTDTRALALILITYLVSLVPTIVEYLRYTVSPGMRTTTDWRVSKISELVMFVNSALNPWIYMFAAESVRSDIRKMCAINGNKKIRKCR